MILQRQGSEGRQHNKGGKASTQPTTVAKHPPEVITNMTAAAKHPPEQNNDKVYANVQEGGKASAG